MGKFVKIENPKVKNASKIGPVKSRAQIGMLIPIVVMLVSTIVFAVFTDHMLFRGTMKNVSQESLQKAQGAGETIRLISEGFEVPARQQYVNTPALIPLQEEIGVLSRSLGVRITVVAKNGIVLADSHLSDFQLAHAKNHALKPEIVTARLEGQGTSQRQSAVLDTEYIYGAASLEIKDKMFIVRVGTPLNEIFAQRQTIRELLALGALSSILIVSLVTAMFGRKLSDNINTDREKLEANVIERTAVLSTLQELGSMLAMCKNLSEAGSVIEAQLPILLPGSSGALSLMNNSRNLLIIDHQWGGTWEKGEIHTPESCWSLRKNEVHLSKTDGLKCQHLDGNSKMDTVCIPLMAQGETLGTIHLRENEQSRFSRKTLDIAHSIGKAAAIAISNLKLRETLEQQALHDPLTGLHNRRHIEEQFENFVSLAKRKNESFCLLIIDIDHFKTYNDQYGHDAGDYVLTQLAKLLRKSVVAPDIACRLGGEEFAIIKSGMDKDQAMAFANDLRMSVEKLNLSFQGRPLGEVTISLGLSNYFEDGTNLPELMKSADDFLYQAKNSGRNRVCSAMAA